MTTTQQPEALRLAKWCDENSSGIYRPAAEAAVELRRLHSRVEILETQLIGMDSRRADEKLRADQMSKQHNTQAALNRDARNQLAKLTSQLEAIGAGGVESLRGAKPLTNEQIKMIDDSTHFHESSDWNLRFARAIEKHHGIGA